MKKIFLLWIFLISSWTVLFAQVPSNFNYQAVLRDNTGELIRNQNVNVRVAIVNDVNSTIEFYSETHSINSNNYGVINIQVGNGSPINNTFEDINWSDNNKFIKTEIDLGEGYVNMGTIQLISVPYSFYANFSDSSVISNMSYLANESYYSDSSTVSGIAHSANSATYSDSSDVSRMTYIANSAFYSDSSDVSRMAHSAKTTTFSDSASVAGMAYSANTSNFADSASVAALAHNSYTADFASSADLANTLSQGVYSTDTDTLFVVKDHDGNVVFAVFPDGAEIIVNETTKGKIGGFAVSGRNPAKATDTEILRITQDSTRIYVNDTVTNKGKIGGFAVSGRNPAKNINTEILFVTADSTRVYVNEASGTKGKVGGFAVSGRNPAKGTIKDYLQVTKDSTRVYVEESATKGKIGGFAVSGRNPAKGTTQAMFFTTIDSTRIFTQDTVGGFGVYDRRSEGSSSYMHLTPLNYFIGHNSGEKIEYDPLNPGMGKYNTFFGYKAGENTVNGFKNIFLGYQAGRGNVGGGWNIFIGNEAGYSSTGGLSNIFIGDQAGYNFNYGTNNIFIGNDAGVNSGNGVFNNLFVGNNSGNNNQTGYYNTYIGTSSGANAIGSNNTFVGNICGYDNTGSQNTFLGCEAAFASGSSNKNVMIGYRSGYRTTGSRNVFVGNAAHYTTTNSTYSNCIAIGDSVIVTGSNQIRIGNSGATSLYLEGAHNMTSSGGTALYINSSGKVGTVVSSKRYKTDIVDLEINTSNIYKLRPVSYTLKSDNERYFGLIAEEVAEVIPNLVEFVKAKDVIPNSTSNEMIPNSVHYPILSVLLLNEIQRHQKIVENQTGEIAKLKKENEDLKTRLEKIEEILFNN